VITKRSTMFACTVELVCESCCASAIRKGCACKTQEIERPETELNGRVYGMFGLTPEEIAIVEESTKYRYGDV
jgi:hypothetical protein